jgi:mannose-6-phosphate isomerase-like protein (cupin superfamily)
MIAISGCLATASENQRHGRGQLSDPGARLTHASQQATRLMIEHPARINLVEAINSIEEHWSPRIAGQVNDSYVKLAKIQGEFVWHQHDEEDELFLVLKGRLLMELRDRDLWLDEGEFTIIPHGVEHRPVAEEEVHLLLFEPTTTVNTGEEVSERTVTDAWL